MKAIDALARYSLLMASRQPPTMLTTAQAAAIAGVTPAGLRSSVSRHLRLTGEDLRAPKDLWPDQRTPVYADPAFRAWLAGRPGAPVQLQRPATRSGS